MSELKKNFSDYQNNECETIDDTTAAPAPLEKELCPTCIKDPNFKLDRYWWEIEEAYLNRKFCEYRVRVYDINVDKFGVVTPDERKEFGIRKILRKFKKVRTTEVIEDLMLVASTNSEPVFRDPNYGGSYGDVYCVSIPAFNFDQVPNDTSLKEGKTPEEKALTAKDIIINVDTFKFDWIRLKAALKTYGYFYRAAQHMDNILIVEEQNPVNRINYESAITQCENFQEILDSLLADAGYSVTGVTLLNLFRKRADKIKFVFNNEDDQPFGLQSVLILEANGCKDYIELEGFEDLDVPEFNIVYNFLSNLTAIQRDITAQETKPWLEFTLDYFYPQMVVDLGLLKGDYSVEQKDALACLLDKEIGLDGGLLDSVANEVLSYFDVIGNELQKEACRAINESFRGTPGFKGDEKLDKERKNFEAEQKRKKKRIIEQYKNDFKNQAKEQIAKQYNDYLLNPLPNPWGSSIKDILPDAQLANTSNVFQVIESNGKLASASDSFGLFPKAIVKLSYKAKDQTVETLDNFFTGQTVKINEDSLEILVNRAAQKKYEDLENQFLGNSPYYADYKRGLKERREKDRKVFDEAKALFKVKRAAPGTLKSFISSIGLCGINKLVGSFFKCLLGGIKIEDLLDKIVAILLDNLKIDFFALLLAELPTNVREEINAEIEKQFGKDLTLDKVLRLALAQDPNAQLSTFMTLKKKAKEVENIFAKYRRLEGISDDELLFLDNLLTETDKTLLADIFDPDVVVALESYPIGSYDYVNGVYQNDPASSGDNTTNKTRKKVLKEIKKAIREKEKANSNFGLISAALSKPGPPEPSPEVLQAFEELQNPLPLTDDQVALIYFDTFGVTLENYPDYNDLIAAQAQIQQDQGLINSYRDTLLQERVEFLEGIVQPYVDDVTESNNVRREAWDDVFNALEEQFQDAIITDQDEFEKAAAAFEETKLGRKVDAVFDVVFDIVVDELQEILGIDRLFDILKKYPGAEILIGLLEKLEKECPLPSMFQPPPEDFMKSLRVDICDGTFQLSLPKLIIPTFNWRFKFTEMFTQALEDALERLVVNLLSRLVLGSLNNLESLLCKGLDAVGGFALDAITGKVDFDTDSFLDALDEAFCKGAVDDAGKRQAEKLADELFGRKSDDFNGMGNRVTNVISSVATKDEFLNALVAEDGENDVQAEERIANAVSVFVPEAAFILGTAPQVRLFFKNLGSYLSADDKQRIRDLLASGVPNLPISSAICLTNEQLDEWNKLREDLLKEQGMSEEDAKARVTALNNATLDALEDVLDDLASLSSEDGPFIAPLNEILTQDQRNPLPAGSTIDDIYDNNESCTDNVHPLNKPRSDQAREFQQKMTDAEFASLETTLKMHLQMGGSILGEALRDTQNKNALNHGLNVFFSGLYDWIPGAKKYINDTAEYDGNKDTTGQYPDTVGLYLREQIFDKISVDTNQTDSSFELGPANTSVFFFPTISSIQSSITPAKNLKFSFQVGEGVDSYYYDVSSTYKGLNRTDFEYRLNIVETLGNDEISQNDAIFRVPVGVDEDVVEYIRDLGFNYGYETPQDMRKEIFKLFVNEKNPNLQGNYSGLYGQILSVLAPAIVQEILTNPEELNGYPLGFQFGYGPDDLTDGDFEYQNPDGSPYNKAEEEKVLGKYPNPRIIVLNPEIYGGRYSNPPIYIEPPKFSGWYDIKDRVFESDVEGCDPKTPALLSLSDIKDRVKKLDDQIKPDPRLSQNPDCVSIKPFAHLLNPKNASSIDGKVRVTMRTYLVEYFLRAFGVFSNLDYRSVNYDSAFSQYVISKMKQEMIDLGIPIALPFVRIIERNYWYTFLEQSVEAYQRMIDIDGLSAPSEILDILDELKLAAIAYDYPTPAIKESFLVQGNTFKLPGRVPSLSQAVDDRNTFYRHAMAYKVYGESIFSSTDEISLPFVETYSLKKIRFYSKIYFLRLAEEKASIIMAEIMNAELRRITKNYSEAPTSKPYIYDLQRHLFGMPTLFTGTTSRAGLRKYYIEKQTGTATPGDVPNLKTSDELSSELSDTEEPVKLVLEKYIRVIDKPANSLVPSFIANRDGLRGVVNIDDFRDFLSDNENFIDDLNISDCFGDLTFVYRGTLEDLFKKEFTSAADIDKLISLNPEMANEIRQALASFSTGLGYQDQASPRLMSVLYDDSFILEGENPTPVGTQGSTGLSYGLRISAVTNINGQTTRLNLVSSEVEIVDHSLSTFSPSSGPNRFDLECLINKMVTQADFRLLFDNLFSLRQIASMTAIYCSHGFAPSLGFGAGEREEPDEDNVDDWNKTFNEFAKEMLRMQFAGLYLSNDSDGDQLEESKESSEAFALLNPFKAFNLSIGINLKIPWFRRKRIKRKVFDKNGVDCANPLRDLQ